MNITNLNIVIYSRTTRLVASAFVAVLFVMTSVTAAQASPNIKTILRKAPTSEYTNADELTWLITFSEPVENAPHPQSVDPTDFKVSGTTATLTLRPLELDEEGCSRQWDATLSGGDLAGLNGKVMIEPFIVVKDGPGTPGHVNLEKPDILGCLGDGEIMTHPGPNGQNDNTFVVDNTKPTVTITDVPRRTSDAFTATFTFDETVSGFEAADITVIGGTKGTFVEMTSGKAWTLAVTPSVDYRLAVVADAATDDAGNGNAATTASGDYIGVEPPPPPPVLPPPPPPVSPPVSPLPPPPPASAAPVVTRTLATSMVINWQAPEGLAALSYDLRYREGSTGDFIDGPQNIIGTRTTILGLNPDTEYEIQVRASNSTGDGEWSELGTARTSTLIPSDRFSLSLDLDDSEGDQFMSFLAVSPDGIASIQIFGRSLKAIPVNDLSVRFEYDATQMVYEGFKRGLVVSGTSALSGNAFVNIGMTLSDSEIRVDSGLVGTLRFRMTDAITETEIRLVRVKLLQVGQSETLPMFLSVALQGSSIALPVGAFSADFNRNGVVDIPDFLLFVDVFGLKKGQERYEAKYDLDKNDEIGIPDFLVFVDNFGKEMSRVPVFTSTLPVTRFVEENTLPGPIGEPISATSADGESLTYSLWGVDAEYFTVDASTGQLEAKEAYNFEERNWYSPIVRVSDGKGGQVSVVVGVAIIDVAE